MSNNLRGTGYPRPFWKRLARLVTGLLASDQATTGPLSAALESLAITPAKAESIGRRLQRILGDPRLDPTLLPTRLRPLLPNLLRPAIQSPQANIATPAAAHARFVRVTLILDESSQAEHVHLLVVGIPIGGLVLPLAVRTGQQNAPLPDGEYWTQVTSLLQEVQELLPAALRDHVLLVADRASGIPRMLDLLRLGWSTRHQGLMHPYGENYKFTIRYLHILGCSEGRPMAAAGASGKSEDVPDIVEFRRSPAV